VETLFRRGGKRLRHFAAHLFRKRCTKFHQNHASFVGLITKIFLSLFFWTHSDFTDFFAQSIPLIHITERNFLISSLTTLFCTLQADGTLTRSSQCLDSPARGSVTSNQGTFYNAPISNGSSLTPQKKKPAAAASVNAKKMFDEVRMLTSSLSVRVGL